MKTFLLLMVSVALVACSDSAPTTDDLEAAERIHGVAMTDAERELMIEDIVELRDQYEQLRQIEIPNDIAPALVFEPGFVLPELPEQPPQFASAPVRDVNGEYAYLSIAELGALLRAGKTSSLQLTEYFIARLRQYDPQLHFVITLTEDTALAQAKRMDAELAAGKDRGPLHGIPYGLKDLFAVAGYPTTWGATPYRDQIIDGTATVARKLEAAGAVLIAKTSVGALAWGDVWFGGMTRSPWNTEEGSSGSSAGSAAGVAAGILPFAIGTETWGSIVSPSVQNGVTGLRPTFGRVSRAGAMALSWSMDKVGPICRFAEDCAMVFDAIRGSDGIDLAVRDAHFPYRSGKALQDFRWGWLNRDFREDYEGSDNDGQVIDRFDELDIPLVKKRLPDMPVNALSFVLSAEAAAAFDELTRSHRDDEMVRQERYAWPNVFRTARFIPAVEYIQANRLRTLLVREMDALLTDIDVLLAPCFAGDQLLLTNLTGHPSMVIPNGFDENNMPTGICLVGKPFEEHTLVAAARALQGEWEYHLRRPPQFK